MSLSVRELSHVQLFATRWTVAHQAPLSLGFSRQEYWSGLLFPAPGDLPKQGWSSSLLHWQAEFLTTEPPRKPLVPVNLSRKDSVGHGNQLSNSCRSHGL